MKKFMFETPKAKEAWAKMDWEKKYRFLLSVDTDFHDKVTEFLSEQAGNGGEVVGDIWDYEDPNDYQHLVEDFMKEMV